MKIEKLTDNKIRIIINLEELSEQNIDIFNLTNSKEKIYELFDGILKEAEKQVGFKAQDCRLLIEAFSSSEGYIIFTFTKYKNNISTEKNSKKLKYKRKTFSNNYQNAIYKFNDFEEFCNFCTYCYNSKLSDLKQFAKNISLYEYNNSYYLVFSNINNNYSYINLFYTVISEFSNLVSTSIIYRSKLQEFGKVIFKANAVKNGIKYFSIKD